LGLPKAMTPPHRGSGGERQGSEHTGKRLDAIATSTATKFQPTPMTVYDGRIATGEIEDHGVRDVRAWVLDSSGDRVSVGTFPDRKLAIRGVVVARHRGVEGAGGAHG
jgi:hypothetical protein